MIDLKKIEIIKNRKGFIAALDQSGGSSTKTLINYGYSNKDITSKDVMFDLIHEFRLRVINNNNFNSNYIIGTILFEKTARSIINNKYISNYLWEDKKIISFLKIDNGLDELKNGVKLMKDIDNLEDKLKLCNELNIFGTKMRSVIYEYNKEGIASIVKQQFEVARLIAKYDLVPIIEPEVDINAKDRDKIEKYLKECIKEELKTFNDLLIFKLSLPCIDNFYLDLYEYKNVLKIVALSGGYKLDDACNILKRNNKVCASFSRAFLSELKYNQTDNEFSNILLANINKIYDASIT